MKDEYRTTPLSIDRIMSPMENQPERHRLMVLVDQVLSAHTKVVISVSQKIENAPETLRTASLFATNQESATHGPITLPSTSPTLKAV